MPMPRNVLLALALCAGLPGCDDVWDPETCVKHRVSVTRGVYGQIFHTCDIETCTPDYIVSKKITIYDRDPTPPDRPRQWGLTDDGTTVTPVATVRSVDQGFYEANLAFGTYYICAGRCEAITVDKAHPLVRWDCCSHPGGSWWEGSECYHP